MLMLDYEISHLAVIGVGGPLFSLPPVPSAVRCWFGVPCLLRCAWLPSLRVPGFAVENLALIFRGVFWGVLLEKNDAMM